MILRGFDGVGEKDTREARLMRSCLLGISDQIGLARDEPRKNR